MPRFRALTITFSLTAAITTMAVAAALVAPAALAVPATHGPATPAQAAAGWLARQMTDRSHFVEVFSGVTYPAHGETIDAILAFAATGTASDYAARATTWLEKPSVLSD